jgi:glycosyltransferase involved in cell wall biosynthesis
MHRLQDLLVWRADVIIANAASARSDANARGIPDDRIAVIRNGIDTDVFRPDNTGGQHMRKIWRIGADDFVIGMVARLDPMKDHSTFFAAAADFAGRNDDARFVCVGDGPVAYASKLTRCTSELQLEGRLLLVREIDNLREAYNAFDILTLSSSFGEGFPNVIGEALACGIPVVSTDVGDARSIVGECGEIVPINRPKDMSFAWQRLRQRLNEAPVALRSAARARIVDCSNAGLMVQKTEELLIRLVSDDLIPAAYR